MKQLGLLMIAFFCALILTSCTSNCQYPIHETWMREINLDSNKWPSSCERRFLNTQGFLQYSDKDKILKPVKGPHFNALAFKGNFEIQIIGNQESNSVYIYGSKLALSLLNVDYYKRELIIQYDKKREQKLKKELLRKLKSPENKIVIYVGIRNLCSLKVYGGNSCIYGKDIYSTGLSIDSANKGNIFLKGNINLSNVKQTGSGQITILDAYTPCLDLNVKGNGNINISGRVGIRYISHCGNGLINILGADTDCLSIYTTGGIISVVGCVNLQSIRAKNSSCVFVYWVTSNNLNVCQKGGSCVGIAGMTQNLNLESKGSSWFQGQYLQTCDAYVQTCRCSIANITAKRNFYGDAKGKSRVYLFTQPQINRFQTNDAAIIPLYSNMQCVCS